MGISQHETEDLHRPDPHDRRALRRRIRRAFARVPQHDSVLINIHLTHKDAHGGVCFEDIPWQAVPEWMVKRHHALLTSFTREAFRQFIPVWLLGALDETRNGNDYLDAILSSLSPSIHSFGFTIRDLTQRLSLFNKAQLGVLECFLQNVMLDSELHSFFARAQRTLRALREIGPSILKAALYRHAEWSPFCAIKRLNGSTIATANLQRLDEFVADVASELDLTHANLAGLKLDEVWIERGRLRGADLTGTDLRRARLSHADLRGAVLTGARLQGADLTLVAAEEASFKNADLRECRLYGADLQDADLTGADLRGADLRRAKIYKWQLADVNLKNTSLRGASVYE